MSRQKPLIVTIGLDEHQRTHAARFDQSEETAACKAAALMGYQVGVAETGKAMSLAKSLPKGRVFTTGRALIPYVKLETFAELQTAMLFDAPTVIEQQGALENPGDPLSIGAVVLALETRELGWWEAVVLDVNGESVTLKWRDWPKLKRFTRSPAELGIIGAAQLPVTRK